MNGRDAAGTDGFSRTGSRVGEERAREAAGRSASVVRRPLRVRPLTLVLLCMSCVFVGRLPESLAMVMSDGMGWSAPIEDVRRAITRDYVEAVDQEELQRGAIDGMLEVLGDDYAEYVPPMDKEQFEKELTGVYSGIGAEVDIRDDWLVITSPMEDSPALKAGIMPNDRVIKVGETSTHKLSVDECIRLLTGPEGTPVTFTVLRAGQEIEFTIIRKRITARSVRGVTRRLHPGAVEAQANGAEGSGPRWNYMLDPQNKIAYIRLSQFTPTAGQELIDALAEAYEQAGGDGFRGVILDLRENPGGALEAAVQIADTFLDGKEVVSIRPRVGDAEVYKAHSDDLDKALAGTPLLVMVDGISASASEIVAGALQDHKRAVVLGSRTFGKGLVQNVIELSHQRRGQVKFTTARYYLPSGRLIQREDDSAVWGVDPDPGFYMPETDDELFARITRRRELDVLRAAAAEGEAAPITEKWNDAEWVRTEAKDAQLAGALTAVQQRIASGEWRGVSEAEAQPARIAVHELEELREVQKTLALELGRVIKQIGALENAGIGEKPRDQAPDLWADDKDVTGGMIEVKDKDGNVVSTVRITGRDLERWLANADVEPMTGAPASADPASGPRASPAIEQGSAP